MTDLTKALQEWFAARLPGAKLLSDVVRRPMGFSNDTFMIDLRWQAKDGAEHTEAFVLRAPPANEGLLTPYDLAKQFGVMDKLAGSPVPVPQMRWYESDTSVIGREFFVMQKSDGVAFELGIAPEIRDTSPAAQQAMVRTAIRAIADVHSFDWKGAGIDFLGDGSEFLQRELDHWYGMYQSSAVGKMPAFEHVRQWLEQHMPLKSSQITLVHGDAKWGNFLWSADGGLQAVLDWEMCGIGDPLTDLGYYLTIAFMADEATPSPLPAGLKHDEIVELYVSYTNAEIHDLQWYEALAAFKLAAILLRMHRMFVDGKTDDLRFAIGAQSVQAFIRRALLCTGSDPGIDVGNMEVPPGRVAEAFGNLIAQVILPNLSDEQAIQQAQMIPYVAMQTLTSA